MRALQHVAVWHTFQALMPVSGAMLGQQQKLVSIAALVCPISERGKQCMLLFVCERNLLRFTT